MPSVSHARQARRSDQSDARAVTTPATSDWRPARWAENRTSRGCCWTIRPTTRSRRSGCWRAARRSASRSRTAHNFIRHRGSPETRRYRCRNCSSPAAAIRCAASPSTRPDRAIRRRGYAIGGQGLFVNNLEIRTPPVQLPFVGNNLGFVFFHDMGNVFDTANHMLSGMLRLNQPSIAECASPSSTGLQLQLQLAGAGHGHTLQHAGRPGALRPGLRLQSNTLSRPRAGQSDLAAQRQFLFQYWTNVLMKPKFAIFALAVFLAAGASGARPAK